MISFPCIDTMGAFYSTTNSGLNFETFFWLTAPFRKCDPFYHRRPKHTVHAAHYLTFSMIRMYYQIGKVFYGNETNVVKITRNTK